MTNAKLNTEYDDDDDDDDDADGDYDDYDDYDDDYADDDDVLTTKPVRGSFWTKDLKLNLLI
jgi:hypothetical protein